VPNPRELISVSAGDLAAVSGQIPSTNTVLVTLGAARLLSSLRSYVVSIVRRWRVGVLTRTDRAGRLRNRQVHALAPGQVIVMIVGHTRRIAPRMTHDLETVCQAVVSLGTVALWGKAWSAPPGCDVPRSWRARQRAATNLLVGPVASPDPA
jgi:hypothetical protein